MIWERWRRLGRILRDRGIPVQYDEPPCVMARYRTEAHHDRPGGAPATDERTAPLCTYHHRIEGPYSVENLGREMFQDYHGIDMDEETARTEAEWQAYKAQGVFE